MSKGKVVQCLQCGKDVISTNFSGRMCCSKECSTLRRRAREAKGRSPYYGLPIKCLLCGTEFIPNKHVAYKAKFCSKICKNRAKSRSQYHKHKQKNLARSTAWRIAKKWGGNWYAALQRDGHKCCLCKSSEQLLVHHKDGEGETGAENHQLENLQTLCCSCHTKMHRVSLIFRENQWWIEGSVFDAFPEISMLPVFRK